MGKQVLRTAIAVTALAAATAVTWASGTPRAHAEPECFNGSNDFDGNGYADLAVGSPGADGGRGAVDVFMMGEGKPERIRVSGVDYGDTFGSAVGEVAYFTDELDPGACTQLVVGAPGRDVDGIEDAGAVFVLKWNPGDRTFGIVKELVQGKGAVPGGTLAHAQFGSSLASPHHEPDIGDIRRPLYIGAPGYAIAGNGRAGAVVELTLTGSSEQPSVHNSLLLTQGYFGVPGTPETGDEFGATLAALDNGVLIGTPGENGRSGGVVRWRDIRDARFITQNTSGVPGTPEPGDRFGAAVYAALETRTQAGGPYSVLVGAPGEAIGNLKGAGSAIKFVYHHGDFELAKTKGYNQDTVGVAGKAEPDDQFGSSFGSFGPGHLLVGAPGEDVGEVDRAGIVQSLKGDQSWTQGSPGAGGMVEAGDMFGTVMGNALVPMAGEREDGWLSSIAIGARSENDGDGALLIGLPGGSGTSRYYEGAVNGDMLGASLGRTN